MTSELTGMTPRMPWNYAQTIVNRALLETYRMSMWSCLTFEANWTTPSWVTTGTVKVTIGSSIVQFDPLYATPAIGNIGMYPSPVTKRQFRIGVGTIYNIWTYSAPTGTVDTSGTAVTLVSGDTFLNVLAGYRIGITGVSYTVASVAGDGLSLVLTSSAGSQSGATFQVGGIATLDRSYQEPTASAASYSIFQCYFASPVQDFKGWASIRDMVNYNDLYFTNTREWIDLRDPQRTWYQIPTQVVFYQNDLNPASSMYGWPMFEVWGPPTYVLTYQLYGYRKGLALSSPADEIPSCLGEDCVMAKARKYAYEWSEANPQPGLRSANLVTLKRDADLDFTRLYRQYRMQDREMQDAFHTKFRRNRAYPSGVGTYNTITGIASTT